MDDGQARIWRYVLAHDSGMAPCPQDSKLTLSCCKPTIRKNARVGDWVIGFMPKKYGIGQVA
jgi:Nucleotide modification associated domain 2